MKNQERIGSKKFEERLEGKIPLEKIQLVMIAYRLAKYGHKGDLRDDGVTRVFEHPKSVALIHMDELHIFDYRMIIGALLHDIREDSHILLPEDIALIFGKRVAHYVAVLTKDVHIEQYLERLQRASRKSQIIKLADRLHNMRTLYGCTKEKQERKIEETQKYFLDWARKTNTYLYLELQKAIALHPLLQ